MAETNKDTSPKITGAERKQRGPFKKRRAGIVLSKDEVKEIKAGRKRLRRQMRELGIRDKKEFELTASSLGLYFDKHRALALLWWWLWNKGLWALLALAALGLGALYMMSVLTDLQGHFTISMSDRLFREGFSLSETADFANPTSHLFSTPAEGVPCISIKDIDSNVDDIDGEHNADYFAYTFYVRNEGEEIHDMSWQLRINSESQNLSDATWAMIFEDGKMKFYAKADEEGNLQMLPPAGDNSRGYTKAPLYDKAADPEGQFEIVSKTDYLTYWRVIPEKFESDAVVKRGVITEFEPWEVHKFTVVLWLEGDDPQCTDDLIGGHLGMDFYMEMVED